jgi:hypothetical protein
MCLPEIKITSATLQELGRLQQNYLSASCRSECALYAARRLGPLAPWWLSRDALELACSQQPDLLPQAIRDRSKTPIPEPGLALVCCLWPEDIYPVSTHSNLSLLRPAMVLPVRWVESKDACPGIPVDLQRLAQQVVRQLGPKSISDQTQRNEHAGSGSAGLAWALGCQADVDASTLPLAADSAWVSLAVGYLVWRDYNTPRIDTRVWATAAYDPDARELRAVDGIRNKLQTMMEFGARHIFVPPQNLEEARRVILSMPDHHSAQVQVSALNISGDPRALLGPISAVYPLPPDMSAGFEEKRDYYIFVATHESRESKKSREFYREYILPDVICKCREQLSDDLRSLIGKVSYVVGSASFNPETLVITYKVFEPAELILLCNDNDKRGLNLASELFNKYAVTFSAHELSAYRDTSQNDAQSARDTYMRLQNETCNLLQQLLKRSPGPILIDLTPGDKRMTLALLRAKMPQVRYIYLSHIWERPSIPRPGSECFIEIR